MMRILILLLFGSLIGFLSCLTGTDGDGNGYDQTTVLGTLYLFQDVWNNGDVTAYENLLDEDNFTFYFDPRDVQDHGLPDRWWYYEEIAAFTNIFAELGEDNVDVALDFSEVTEPEEGAETYLVEEVPYEVHVHVSEGEYDITYIARANLDMELTKVDGEWVITKWWDRVTSLLLGEDTSWGAIKAEF